MEDFSDFFKEFGIFCFNTEVVKSILYSHLNNISGLADFPFMGPHEQLMHFHYLHKLELLNHTNPDMLKSHMYLVPLNPGNAFGYPDHLIYIDNVPYAIQNKHMVKDYCSFKFKKTNYKYSPSSDLISVSGFFKVQGINPIASQIFVNAFPLGVESTKFAFVDLSYMLEAKEALHDAYVPELHNNYAVNWNINKQFYVEEARAYIKDPVNLKIHNWEKTNQIRILLNMHTSSNGSLKTAIKVLKNLK